MAQLARTYLYILLITGLVTSLSAENCNTSCSISCNTGDIAAQSQPHASITNWMQGSYGNYPGVGHQKPALPIYVRIAFDQDANADYVNNYFKFLNQFAPLKNTRPARHGKFREEYVMTVNASIARHEIESILDQANRHFDPEIKRNEDRVIQQAKEKVERDAAAKIAAEAETKRRAEEERLKKEVAEKAAAERRAHIQAKAVKDAIITEQIRLKAEAEQCRLEAEEPVDCDIYLVSPLPDLFNAQNSFSLNEHGQVAGSMLVGPANTQAAIWDAVNGLKVFPLPSPSVCIAINDLGNAIVHRSIKNRLGIYEDTQVILWNSNTNQIEYGPFGHARSLNNFNNILMSSRNGTYVWNSHSATMTNHSSSHLNSYIDDNNALLAYYIANDTNAVDFNKSGNAVCMKHGTPALLVNGQYHLITLPVTTTEPSINMKLNNQNEVMTFIEERFVKWHSGRISKSKSFKHIKELKNAKEIWVIGFNSSGQILVKCRTTADKRPLFLLTPKKK